MVLPKGVLLVHDMQLQKKAPVFRTDSDFEEHSLKVFMEYVDVAIDSHSLMIVSGQTLKNLTLKQGLVLNGAIEKAGLQIAVLKDHLRSVSTALLELGLIKVVEGSVVSVEKGEICVGGLEAFKRSACLNGISFEEQPVIYTRTTGEPESLAVKPSLQVRGEEVGECYLIRPGVKPKVIKSSYDDVDRLKISAENFVFDNDSNHFLERFRELEMSSSFQSVDAKESIESYVSSLGNPVVSRYLMTLYKQAISLN